MFVEAADFFGSRNGWFYLLHLAVQVGRRQHLGSQSSKERRCYEPRLRQCWGMAVSPETLDRHQRPSPGASQPAMVSHGEGVEEVWPGGRLWVLGPPWLALGVIPSTVAEPQRLGPVSQRRLPGLRLYAPRACQEPGQAAHNINGVPKRANSDVVLTNPNIPVHGNKNLVRASHRRHRFHG